jgi:thiol-disulfide isomerase/thioredoxin
MRKNPFWSGFVVGILLMAATVFGLWYKVAGIGDQSYDQLELVDLDGKRIDMAQFAGRPLVVDYWATWCKPCIEELKEFETVSQRPDNKVVFLLISDDPLPRVVKFAKARKYSFVFGVSKAPLHLSVRPITLFYDKGHELQEQHTGTLNNAKLLEYIAEVE